jgi:signal transduction histidine kinase
VQEFFASHLYSIIAAISLAVHLIVNWKQLFVWRNLGSRPGAFEIRHFIVCLTVFFTADVLWGVFEELKWRTLLYADTVVFFLTMALTIFAWMHFIAAYLEVEGYPRARLLWTGRALVAFFTVALLLNFFVGGFFSVDEHCTYAAGPVRRVALLLLVAINLYGSVATLVQLLRTEGPLRRRNAMLFAIGATMAAAVLAQLGNPFLPVYGLGCLFGVCVLHVFVIEDERDDMHRKEMIAHDVAAQLEAEREANRAKSLFFSTVSHDIRTPLNAIVGFSELLSQGVEDGAERARCLASIRSSAKVLARLVDDVLDLSKMESGKLEILEEPTDVPALVREVIAACEVARARTSLLLKTDIGEMPWLSVDPQRIRQLLFNLLSNAYKYTAFGTISVRARWEDGTLELAVADTGKGISEEDIARILQPFVQLADRNHRDGTGLGLPICQRLARLMGGELAVESKIGVGSTFTIVLRNVKTAEPPAGRTERAGRPGRVPFRVLVVDDSPVNRAVLRAMLAKSGVPSVSMAENGRKALEKLKADPHFDLVLTDLWMPEMDGCGLVKAIRADAALANLPVYLVTADVEARKQADADGFSGLLLKPVTLGRLQELFA